MTIDEQHIIEKLGLLRLQAGSFDKRFIHGLNAKRLSTPGQEITDGQREWIYRMVYKYRKQLSSVYGRFKNHEYCKPKKSTKAVQYKKDNVSKARETIAKKEVINKPILHPQLNLLF
jgi:hypothetical protein